MRWVRTRGRRCRRRSIEQRPGLRVVQVDRPEVLGGNPGRQREAVGPAAVEPRAGGVHRGVGVCGAGADLRVRHRRCDDGGEVVELGPGVEQPRVVAQKFVAPSDEGAQPVAVRVVIGLGVARLVDQRTGDRGRQRSRPAQDPSHPVVRLERLTMDDADRRTLSGSLLVQRVGGLLLDQRVDLLVEGVVVGVHGVLSQLGHVQVRRRRRVVRLRQRVDPRLHDVRHAAEGTHHQPVRVRRAAEREVPLGLLPLIPGRQGDVLPAGASVRAGNPEVGEVTEPEVVNDAQRVRRVLHDDRSAAQIEEHRPIGRLRVRRQEERPRVGARICIPEHVPVHSDAAKAAPHRD